MNDDQPNDGREQTDETTEWSDMSDAEIRGESLDMLDEADGALLITANLVDMDGDGENDAVAAEGVKFVIEEGVDETDRDNLQGALIDGIMHVVTSNIGVEARAMREPGEGGIEDLVSALLHDALSDADAAFLDAMRSAREDADDDEDDPDDDDEDPNDGLGGMYA